MIRVKKFIEYILKGNFKSWATSLQYAVKQYAVQLILITEY